MNTVTKCEALIQSLQAQIELVKRIRGLELDLAGSVPGASRDDIVTNICHLHRMLGVGSTVTNEQIDMLLVV